MTRSDNAQSTKNIDKTPDTFVWHCVHYWFPLR